jgi:hypothetical protein
MSAVLSMRSRDVAVSDHDSHDLVLGHSAGWADAINRGRLVAPTEATVPIPGQATCVNCATPSSGRRSSVKTVP